jgi:hypothetical protein
MRAMRATATAAALCLSLTSCAMFGSRAPEETSLAVDLSVSRAEAVRRTLSAFREEGYSVRATLTSGLTPQTEPFRQGDAEAVFRAVVSGSARASRVVLSGTYHRVKLGGTIRGKEQDVRRSDDAVERALWNRLDQLRLAIRQPAR